MSNSPVRQHDVVTPGHLVVWDRDGYLGDGPSVEDAAGIPEAPSDGEVYGRADEDWQRAVAADGDTMTGLLTLSGDPTADEHAATKKYVDALIAPLVARIVELERKVEMLTPRGAQQY